MFFFLGLWGRFEAPASTNATFTQTHCRTDGVELWTDTPRAVLLQNLTRKLVVRQFAQEITEGNIHDIPPVVVLTTFPTVIPYIEWSLLMFFTHEETLTRASGCQRYHRSDIPKNW